MPLRAAVGTMRCSSGRMWRSSSGSQAWNRPVPPSTLSSSMKLCTGDPLCQGTQVALRMQLAHHGGAELVGHRTLQQERHAFVHTRKVEPVHPDGFRVALRRVLHVHGHIVHQPLAHERPQPVGEAAVRVQLDGESAFAHVSAEIGQARLEQRLPAGDAYAVQKPLPLVQEGEEVFELVGGEEACRIRPCACERHLRLLACGHGRLLVLLACGHGRRLRHPSVAGAGGACGDASLAENQVGVVAERAAEVASRCEHGGRRASWKIEQREFLYAGKLHACDCTTEFGNGRMRMAIRSFLHVEGIRRGFGDLMLPRSGQ